MEKKRFNYMLESVETDILRNCSQNNLGVLRGAFYGFRCPKRHPDALLAKTMLSPIKITLTGFVCTYDTSEIEFKSNN